MGVGCSQSSSAVKPAYAGRSNWRAALSKEEARSLYESDGSVPSGSSNELIHFRTYLEAPICLRAFAMYCKYKDEKLSNYLLCWLDILQFSMISEMDIEKQFDKGFLLYGKYMNGPQLTHIADAPEFTSGPVDSKLDGLTIPSEWYDNTASILQNCKTDNQALPPKLFSEYGRHCLVYLYENAFQSFIRSPGYKESILYLKEKHNVIDVNDFEYIEKVGQGAFGCVVKCVKKSTGKAYAMKIQTKIGLLDSYSDDPSRVCLERNALVKTRHPFIVSLDYAFQTQQLVILVMDLGTKGTLYDAMMNSKRTCLPEKSVVFYAAEIFLALVHIHNAGMIYRDLKPQNVLLNADGHIKLVDMGGIIDVNVAKMESSERIFGEAARNNSYSNMVKKDLSISMSKSAIRKGTTAVSRTGGGLEVKQRATSIMGTE